MTGHSYIVYGPLSNGAIVVMYEGAPDYPDKDRFWRLDREVRRHDPLHRADARSARSCAGATSISRRQDLSTLRLLGTVGEPINPEAWMWYYENIGKERCPMVDTWWQTETGMIMIYAAAGDCADASPARRPRPSPVSRRISWTSSGNACQSTPAAIWSSSGPGQRCRARSGAIPTATTATYWSKYPGIYLTGDGARRDEDGYYWLLGRVDDVLNVSGHRIGTMEIESALVSHPAVAEAAVIGASGPDDGAGHRRLRDAPRGYQPNDALTAELREHVVRSIGALARPKKIYYTQELPKTRSAKIMRRLLRDIAEGRVLGDTTTLLDPNVVAQIKEQYESSEG